jgi:hypothetical protein
MLPRGHGHIINIASLGSLLPTEGIATYCATKHAVLGYTDTVRRENRGSGVHFSAIMPTLINTDMIAGVGRGKGFKNAEPDDVARAVAGVIAKPKPRVHVPRSIGVVVVRPAFDAAACDGGDGTRLGYWPRLHQRCRGRQAHGLCPAHWDVLILKRCVPRSRQARVGVTARGGSPASTGTARASHPCRGTSCCSR